MVRGSVGIRKEEKGNIRSDPFLDINKPARGRQRVIDWIAFVSASRQVRTIMASPGLPYQDRKSKEELMH